MKVTVKNWIGVLLVLFVSGEIQAQKAKVEGIYVSNWQFPKTIISPDLSTFHVGDIVLDPRIKVFLGKPDKVHPPNKVKNYKNTLLRDFLEKIRLRQFRYVNGQGDLLFKVVKNDVQIRIEVEEKKSYRTTEPPSYVAKIYSLVEITVDIQDNEGNSIVVLKEKKNRTLLSKENNSRSEAKRMVLGEFRKDQDSYLSRAMSNYYGSSIDVLEKIIKEIDYTVKKERVNVFVVSKAEKYKATEVNELVKKLRKVNFENIDPAETSYISKVEKIAKKFEGLLINFSEKDKRERKIRWAILSNLSACSFMVQDYKKALDYIAQRESIKYKRGYIFNKQLINEKIHLKNSYEAKTVKRDQVTHDYYMGLRSSKKSGFWHHESNSYVRYFVDTYFVKESSVEGMVINPETYFNVLFKKIKYLKKKKDKFYQKEVLKEMVSYANENDRTVFFDKYAPKIIDKNLTGFDFNEICDFYRANEIERKLFKNLIEKAADVFKQYTIEGYKGDAELNKRLLKSLHRYEMFKDVNQVKDYGDVIYFYTSKELMDHKIHFDELNKGKVVDYINRILSFATHVVN
ncbi:hypothetical protein [uncultured Tenacibaculum sp.]|uniref:hypothetical protein n=1 Tax=uncultured Tenacibaculum sp. TaxID=174713 RepID=UPI0026250284|nr:hypothetical protein [uncultured Tenacibaculum sp.]